MRLPYIAKEYINLKTLQQFSISSNNISKLEGLDNLKALHLFYISSNEISKLEGLVNLKALQDFDISSNKISKFEGLDKQAKNIKTFNISENPISIEVINQALSTMPNLEELSLKNLKLTTLPEAVLTLKQLKTLDLRNFGDDSKNVFSKEEQEKIKKLLPNCKIEF